MKWQSGVPLVTNLHLVLNLSDISSQCSMILQVIDANQENLARLHYEIRKSPGAIRILLTALEPRPFNLQHIR